MNEAKVIEVEEKGGKKGYLIVGSRQQCISRVVSLETKGEGYWYQIGYWNRDPRNERNDILVWKFFYGKPDAMATIKMKAHPALN